MLRNQEFKRFTVLFVCFSLCMCFLSIQLSLLAALLMLISLGCSYLLFAAYTYQRHQTITRLSNYLQAVYQGEEAMDIREHCEGELSILKSDLYKVTSILKQQAAALQKDKSFLATSLSDISHQLKTPLTSMMVMSDLLQEELPEEKRIEFIQQIQIQLKRIEWLVSALLKLSKIDANAVVFHFQKYALHDLLDLSLLPLRIPMELKEQRIELQCEEHVAVLADENWIVEAFTNILKNCMEHTPQGGALSISCKDNPLHTVIEIKDTGEGIDPRDLPHIFERFYKGKNAASDSAGIGLALAKTILIQHNARIQVESTPGLGSCFTICFYK